MADEVAELTDFLTDRRPEVKLTAVDIVQGLTASAEGIDRLKAQCNKLLVNLFRLITEAGSISEKALASLVNLSQDVDFSIKLLELNVVGRVMDYIREKLCPHISLLVMLLANVSISQQGCEKLLQLDQDAVAGLHMAVLLKRFVVSGITLGPEDKDDYEHVASVLTNVTRLKAGRELLLQPGRGLLQALVSQLQSHNSTRRLGCAGAIKNCCMSCEEDGTLEQIIADQEVLKRILHPLSGQHPNESDDTVRECMADSILALAKTETGRKALWGVQAPEILKKGYEDEQHPGVCKAMEDAAQLFMFHSEVTPEDPSSGKEHADDSQALTDQQAGA